MKINRVSEIFEHTSSKTTEGKATYVVYHEISNSVVVVNVNDCTAFINECTLPGLQKIDGCRIPNACVPALSFFIAVCFDGRVMCCQGIDGKSSIWITHLLYAQRWTTIWTNRNLNAFVSLNAKKSRYEDYIN